MSLYVVDASVGIKWFVLEVLSPEVLVFRNSGHDFHVPAFFDVEITNIVWKKLQRGELIRQEHRRDDGGSEAGERLAAIPLAAFTQYWGAVP